MSDYELLLPFDNDDPQFARGFECGRIWALLITGEAEALERQSFHATNAEMVLRMAEAVGVSVRAEFTEDDAWMTLVLNAKGVPDD